MIWPEIGRQALRKLKNRNQSPAAEIERRAAEQSEAHTWCSARSVQGGEALERLGVSQGLVPLESKYVGVFAEARKRAATSPSKLGGAGNVDLLYALCEGIGARRVLETGVAYGWSSLAILLSLKNRPGARLFSVDLPYFQHRNDRWVGVVVPPELKSGWTLYRMADREGLPRAIKAVGLLDLAHYDSDKTTEGRLFAYRLIWRALRPGGILMSDDVSDNLGFRQFSMEIGGEPVIVRQENKFQGLLAKPGEA